MFFTAQADIMIFFPFPNKELSCIIKRHWHAANSNDLFE